jgi:hypothetical protein
MASLGSATLETPPSLLLGGTYAPTSGSNIGTAMVLDLTGEGGGTPVDPKRYLLTAGGWVAIQ